MKKQLVASVCLLLLLCVLLSSCASGLPGYALFKATQDTLSSFSVKIKGLLEDHTPLILDKTSAFSISLPNNCSAALRAAVDGLCAQILERTGVDLMLTNAEQSSGRILMGTADDALCEQLPAELNAANFYIGFCGKDLVIHATNDLMLVSALHYFEQAYVTGKDACIGEGYLLLPDTLSFSSDTLLCNADTFRFAKQGNAELPSYAATLCTVLTSAIEYRIGIHFYPSLNTDSELYEQQKELIVGKVSRSFTEPILSSLADDEFYIGSNGTKVMILANSYPALNEAINLFLSTQLYADDAQYNRKEKSWSLPAYCHYYGRIC